MESPQPITQRSEADLTVPVVDQQPSGRVYDRSIHRNALLGALVGGLVFGAWAYAIATGRMPIVGLGQFAASGGGVALFVGAGVGVAIGGLIGALIALYRLPPRHAEGPQH